MRSTVNTTSRTLYGAFLPFMTFFLCYVAGGYFLSLVTFFPQIPRFAAILICLFVAFFIFLIVRRAAFDFNHASFSGGGVKFLGPILWFGAVLILSAYGFLNSSMLLFEGPQIARENVADAATWLERLSSKAPTLLADPDYDALAGRVRANQDQLMNEIQNVSSGSFCGVGDKAKATIARLKADLPQIDVINGTDRNHDCRDKPYLATLQTTYANLIKNALANTAQAQRARPQDRKALLTHIDDIARRDIGRLRSVGATLAGLPSFIFNIEAYRAAVTALDQADADYGELASSLSSFSDLTAAGLPPTIHDTSLARMSSGLQLFGTIGSRINRPSVILLILLSILGDALATFVTFRAIRHQTQIDVERRSALEALTLSRSGVDYLWRPRLHPLRRE